jgi:hypothetical protein
MTVVSTPSDIADTCLVLGEVAERVGFEPTDSLESALFKSAAFNRSATSP